MSSSPSRRPYVRHPRRRVTSELAGTFGPANPGVRIAAIADLHGHLPEIPSCDLLLIAGDVCPANDHSRNNQREWLRGPFDEWLKSLDARVIVGIAGNHELVAESDPELMLELSWTYLCDSGTEALGLRIYGTPWTTMVDDWAFSRDDTELAGRWSEIPDDVEVLITHTPPQGFGDLTWMGNHAGSATLRKRIGQLKQLRLHVFGHIHEGHGRARLGKATLANVTLVDPELRAVHSPMVFEL